MQKVVKLKLEPDEAQAEALLSDLLLVNHMANQVAQKAMEQQCFSNFMLRKHTYADLRAAGLASQCAQHVIKKVCDAYKTRKSRARNGGYGKPDSERYQRVMGKAVSFREKAAQPFDRRNMSWDRTNQLVALTFMTGRRITDIPYVGREADLEAIATLPVGECYVYRDRAGRWFIVATVSVETLDPAVPKGYLGVDMGIVNLATVADERGVLVADWSGGAVTARRKKNAKVRASLQRKGTRSAKRRLKARSGREQRFMRDVNHQVSKTIIAEAKRTGSGVAVERLRGIRDRVRLRKPQRAMVHSWAFAQLGQFLHYKGCEAGVEVVEVDPRHTSQRCSSCGMVDRKSRRSQASYQCVHCGFSLGADHNAAVNIALRAVSTATQRVAVNLP